MTVRVECTNSLSPSNGALNKDAVCRCAEDIPISFSVVTWTKIIDPDIGGTQRHFYYTTSSTMAAQNVAVNDTSTSFIDGN